MATTETEEPDWWVRPPWTHPNSRLGPTQRRILACLAEHRRRSFTMSEIAAALDIYKSQANNGSHGLVARGFAEVTTPVGTGRVRRVKVTSAGVARLDTLRAREANSHNTEGPHAAARD